jgi:hypothetical protein
MALLINRGNYMMGSANLALGLFGNGGTPAINIAIGLCVLSIAIITDEKGK